MTYTNDALTHVCGICNGRTYACRRIRPVDVKMNKPPELEPKLAEDYDWACPRCYQNLKRLADAEKADDS